MKSDTQIIFDQGVMLSTLTEQITWLERELKLAEDKIRDLYDVIDRHEKELRVFRNKARQEAKL